MTRDLQIDEATRQSAADDFGHVVRRLPREVVRPGSADELAAAVRRASQRGLALAPRGQGHSTFGRSQVAGGIVADMAGLAEIGPVEGDTVTVGAGAKWSDVVGATLAHGRTPPVLPDYLELSVGGTLIVGGVGAATSTHGLVSDNVLELAIVTGTGKQITCATGDELFDAVRAGLGQVGVIVRARLMLVAAPKSVRRCLLAYRDLATMLADARLLTDSFDVVQGAIAFAPSGEPAFRLDAAKHLDGVGPSDDALLAGLSDDPARREVSTIGFFDYLARLAPLETAMRAGGQWSLPHPWLMTFVGDSRIEAVVGAELGALDPIADIGPLGQLSIAPLRSQAISSPLFQLPREERCFMCNLVRIPETGDGAEARRLVEANRAAYERIKASGGTLYPVSALPLSALEWREHFGADFGRLANAKRRFDPHHTLTPGYEIFAQLRRSRARAQV